MSRKKNRKNRLRPAISLRVREIYYVNLQDYKISCPYCRAINDTFTTCRGCGKKINIDITSKGRRPILIVSAPVINPSQRDELLVLGVPITTTITGTFPDSVILPADKQTGLTSPSQANIFNLTSFDKNRFFENNKLGEIDQGDWIKIKEKLRNLLSLENIIIKGKEFTPAEILQVITDRESWRQKIVDLEKEVKYLEGYKIKFGVSQETYSKNKEEWRIEKAKMIVEADKRVVEIEKFKEENKKLRDIQIGKTKEI